MTLIEGLTYSYCGCPECTYRHCPVCTSDMCWLFEGNPARWLLCEDCAIVADIETDRVYKLELVKEGN